MCGLVAVASAGLVPTAHEIEVDSPPHYDFSYSVQDPHTGDVKQQQESRVNDVVQGSYSLIEPDGHKRVVHYTADDHNGFNAVVQREGTVHATPVVSKAIVPVQQHYVQPAIVSKTIVPVQQQYVQPAVVSKTIVPVQQHYVQPATVAVAQKVIAQPQIAYAHAQPQVAYTQQQVAYAAQPQYTGGLAHSSASLSLGGVAVNGLDYGHGLALH